MKLLLASMAILAMATVCLADDPCPQFWVHFNGACYRYFGDRVTWAVANENCRDHYSINGRADLVSIHSEQENSFAYDLFRSAAGGTGSLAGHRFYGAWIGFHQPTAGSTVPFSWTDGTSNADFESWLPGQPDNAGEIVCCHFWRRSDGDDILKSWNDAPCALAFPYICKVAQN